MRPVVAVALDLLLFVLAWAAVGALALAARWWLRRPRLEVELSLHGGTRLGTLYVRIHNRGRRDARDVWVRVLWEGDGREALVAERGFESIEGVSAIQWPIRDLQTAIGGDPVGWRGLRADVRAANAPPASRSAALSARAAAAPSEAQPVRYQKAEATRCPDSPDGRHLFRVARFPNDGVVETWRVCGRCNAVVRDPLTPEEEAIQARIRAERAARERQRLEEELERAAARREPPPRRARPPPVDDAMPEEAAFWILGLDPATARWEDVLAAHRRLAMEHHPDRGSQEEREAREQRMADVNRARDRLRERFGRA